MNSLQNRKTWGQGLLTIDNYKYPSPKDIIPIITIYIFRFVKSKFDEFNQFNITRITKMDGVLV